MSAAVVFALICTGPSVPYLTVLLTHQCDIMSIKPGTLARNLKSGLCLFNVVQRFV